MIAKDEASWTGIPRHLISAITPIFAKAIVVVSIAITWIYVFLRTRPLLDTDYAAFLLVGTRLAQGDKLYVEVWDNKDPLTYWITALISSYTPISSHIVEIAWFVTIAIATYSIARSFELPIGISALAGGTIGPLAVLNLAYFQGATELQGIALLSVAIALMLRNRIVFSGFILGVLVFAKLIFVPVGITAVVFYLLRSKQLASLRSLMASFLLTVVAFIGLLFARGELLGYLDTFRMNVVHSNSRIAGSTPLSISDSMWNRIELIIGHPLVGTLVIVTLFILIAYVVFFKGTIRNQYVLRNAWYVTVVTFLVSFVVIFAASKFPHHLLLIAVPNILVSLLVVSALWNFKFRKWNVSENQRQLVCVVVTLGLSILVSGVMSPLDHKFLAESGWNRINAEHPESTSVRWLREHRQYMDVPISFLGRGSAVPVTTPDLEWNLGCRFMSQGGQFSTQENLMESLDCIKTSEIVIVGSDATPDYYESYYNGFLQDAMNVLSADFDCTNYLDIEVCIKRTVS